MLRENFSIFGKVNLAELFDEWAQEKICDEYRDPSTGWQLKHCCVYENDVCALLFENTSEEETTYYRALFCRGEGEDFCLIKKVRFRETDSFRVDAIGINRDITALFVCRSKENGDTEMYYSLPDNSELSFNGMKEIISAVQKQSRCRFSVVDDMTVMFIETPDGIWFDRAGSDPYDFLGKLPNGNKNEDKCENSEDEENNEDKAENEEDDAKSGVHLKGSDRAAGKAAMDELNELIGLDNIKETIGQITAFAKLQKMAKKQGRKVAGINLNLSFLGNPGTAKTTVARLFARIMKENGILSKGELIEVGRSDLVAKYVGQTAIKVKGVFKRAAGNVLFIDEAYSLVDSWGNGYGDEAIAAIVQEMENNREDMVVIFAGYPDKMEEFLSRNPGLRSRVPFVVKFKDYSADELTEIAKLEAARRGYKIGEGVEEKIRGICASAMKTEEFGNGRFSRNLVEAAIMRSASRTMLSVSTLSDPEAYFTLESCDFAAPDNIKKEEQTRIIGFGAA